MSFAAFLANSGWLNITSQLILPKAAFFCQPPHVLFLSPVCVLHSISTCLSDCSPRLHEHSGESNLGIFWNARTFWGRFFPSSSILPRALAALKRPLYSFGVFFVGFGQIACSSLPIFSLDQASSQRSRVYCPDIGLIIALALSNASLSAAYPGSHSLHFQCSPFLLFSIL